MTKHLYFLSLLGTPISNVSGRSVVLSGCVNDARAGEVSQSGYNSQINTGIRDDSFKLDRECHLQWRGAVIMYAFSVVSSSSRTPKSGKIPAFSLYCTHWQDATESARYISDG